MKCEDGQMRTFRDYVTPGVHDLTRSTTRPPMSTNNFKLKLKLICTAQQSQFSDTPMEDANLHLLVFLEMCNTLKINGGYSDVIFLRLLPFFLRDKARA